MSSSHPPSPKKFMEAMIAMKAQDAQPEMRAPLLEIEISSTANHPDDLSVLSSLSPQKKPATDEVDGDLAQNVDAISLQPSETRQAEEETFRTVMTSKDFWQGFNSAKPEFQEKVMEKLWYVINVLILSVVFACQVHSLMISCFLKQFSSQQQRASEYYHSHSSLDS